MNLLETYAKRLKVSESVYAKEHDNASLTQNQKVVIARVLANTSAFLNESFSNSVGTQRADMGSFKKFCLDLTTVALPNLIANELVIVKAMTSESGNVRVLKFVAGSTKGGVKQGDEFNSPFALGDMTEDRANYTSGHIVEAASAGLFVPSWTPVVDDKVEALVDDAWTEVKASEGTYTLPENTTKVRYIYDNAVIPANDIPVLNAKFENIPLQAKPRRIAIYYSQMAAYQAKVEAGVDLGDVLATQACAEVTYETDTEIINMLYTAAKAQKESVTFDKKITSYISKAEHYEGFAETLETASQIIYDRTKKHAANYVVIASDIRPILSLMRGWKPVTSARINGPYFAGTINGLKVFISPTLDAGEFFVGYNGDDLMTSAGIYAPFMAVVPTQLVGYADGGMSQGFSTLYDAKVINPALLVAGKVVDTTTSD